MLYKHIIQVENKNVWLKVGGGGGGTNISLPPPPQSKKLPHPTPPPPPFLRQWYKVLLSAQACQKRTENGPAMNPNSTAHRNVCEREMFYLTTHTTHFIYGYMASDIWWRTILIVRKETRCRHIGYSYRLTARVLLYAPSHRQDNTYHGLCYNSRGALAGTRNSSMGPPHEGSIRRPIAPWANALPLSYVPLRHIGM